MKTVVDTSALIALLNADDAHNEAATALHGRAHEEGVLCINDVVYTELAVYFEKQRHVDAFVDDTGLRLEDLSRETLYVAGQRYHSYLDSRGEELTCHRCGHEGRYECPDCGAQIRSKQHIAADFLIGAHAAEQADRLLTFDTGFFSTYFEVEMLTV